MMPQETYLEWRPMFGAKEPLAEKQLLALADDIRARIEPKSQDQEGKRLAADLKSAPRLTPAGAPVLILGGSGDYNLAPLCKSYPSEFLRQFKQVAPQYDVKFSTPSRYLDAVLPGIKSGAIQLPVLRGGTEFTYNAFWIQNPRVKSAYRRCEQLLQAAEMLATAASLCAGGMWEGPQRRDRSQHNHNVGALRPLPHSGFEYPSQAFHHAWLLMCLNMDRNTLWGAAGGMVFEHERSWDAQDRFEWVERTSCDIATRAIRSLAGEGNATVRFNPLNWQRRDFSELSSMGFQPMSASTPADKPTAKMAVPLIQTKFYSAKLDPVTGALVSLKLKSGNRELLGGPANVIVAEQPKKKNYSPGDHMVDRPDRDRVVDSNTTAPKLTVTASPLATVVEAESSFIGGGKLRRKMILHSGQPRIDFETELNDLPDRTVVVAEFPLAGPVCEARRGIPYGFAQGIAKGIAPAVRWSHYQMAGAGVAVLDQGLSGRELNGNTPVIYLYNTAEKYRGYPNAWLSGAGRHVLRYALVAHAGDFTTARIPQMAWEFNNPPILVNGCAPAKAKSFVQTSDNVIVEALRREGGEIELRLAECLGRAGKASVTLNLPHLDAALTDMLGGNRQPLRGGPAYKFPVRPQQIVTMRFKTAVAVAEVKPLTEWDTLVPEKKREALRRYLPDVKGHPPAGGQ